MSATIHITFHSWWHASSGESGVGDVDSAVVRDADGLPYYPGKTLCGLFRDAGRLLAAFGNKTVEIDKLFGQGLPHEKEAPTGDAGGREVAGLLKFSNAELPANFREWARHPNAKAQLTGLFEVLASTAIREGVALGRSLRRTEVVIPCQLTATVSWETDDYKAYLQRCARLIRRMGLHRHRGLGRCNVAIP